MNMWCGLMMGCINWFFVKYGWVYYCGIWKILLLFVIRLYEFWNWFFLFYFLNFLEKIICVYVMLIVFIDYDLICFLVIVFRDLGDLRFFLIVELFLNLVDIIVISWCLSSFWDVFVMSFSLLILKYFFIVEVFLKYFLKFFLEYLF